MKKIIYCLLSLFVVVSCSENEARTEEEQFNLSDVGVIDVGNESEFDMMLVAKESPDYVFVRANESNAKIPELIRYHNSELNKDYSILLNSEGIIDKIVVDDYIILLSNFDGNKFDAGLIYPDGQTFIFKELESNFNWDKLAITGKNNYKLSDLDSLLNYVSNQLVAIPCAMTLIKLAHANPLAILSAFECGVGIGEIIAEELVENGYRKYVSQDVYDNWQDFFEIYDSIDILLNCYQLDSLEDFIECFGTILSVSLNDLDDDIQNIDDNSDVLIDVITSLNTPSFSTEFFDFNDNQTPEGWNFEAIRTANISNGRINAYTNDGVGRFSIEGLVPFGTSEITIEMDVSIEYSYWGLIYGFQVFSNNEYLSFVTGEEDFEYPNKTVANLISYNDGNSTIRIHESLSESVRGTYHLKLKMNKDGFYFSGLDPVGNESFNIVIEDSNYFNYNMIDKIQFNVSAHTDNDGWIDNVRVTLLD